MLLFRFCHHRTVLSLCSKNVQRLEFHTDEVIAFITRNPPVNEKHKHVRKEFLTLSREICNYQLSGLVDVSSIGQALKNARNISFFTNQGSLNLLIVSVDNYQNSLSILWAAQHRKIDQRCFRFNLRCVRKTSLI